MKEIVFLYPANIDSVRLQKFAIFLKKEGFSLSYIGWNRYKANKLSDEKFDRIEYLCNGGGEGTKILPLIYVMFIVRLFLKLLFQRNLSDKIWFAINFETAFVMWLISKVRRVSFIYDIWDEFAISHKFPTFLKNVLKFFDDKIRKKAQFYIHVDENRYSAIDKDNTNSVVIYNTPFDFFDGRTLRNDAYENSFAVTGWLNNTRGLDSIYRFAQNNKEITFYVVGEFIDKKMENHFLDLENVKYNHFLPQRKLFEIIKNCRGIFSLYDPSIEINKLAASNKLYDAMMLSIPVIVNTGIQAADFVKKEHIGYVVNYDYDESWGQLSIFDVQKVKEKGEAGRNLYLSRYEFGSMLRARFLPLLKEKFK